MRVAAFFLEVTVSWRNPASYNLFPSYRSHPPVSRVTALVNHENKRAKCSHRRHGSPNSPVRLPEKPTHLQYTVAQFQVNARSFRKCNKGLVLSLQTSNIEVRCDGLGCRLIDRLGGTVTVVTPFSKSFHEKAGSCQDGFSFSYQRFFHLSRAASVAILPSALFVERFFARCKLGVLNSAGAAT